MSATHIAGLVCQLAGRVVQRCAWCGEKMLDSTDLAAERINPDGTFNAWPPGRLVRNTGGAWTLLEPSAETPWDSCGPMVEE